VKFRASLHPKFRLQSFFTDDNCAAFPILQLLNSCTS
jgi:hypothetical protein